jgi:hypothetical protein
LLSLKSFVAEKRHVVMEKLFIKKEEKEVLRKSRQVSELLKQWVLRCLPKKKRDE